MNLGLALRSWVKENNGLPRQIREDVQNWPLEVQSNYTLIQNEAIQTNLTEGIHSINNNMLNCHLMFPSAKFLYIHNTWNGFKLSFSSVLASLKNGKKWETERQTFDKVVLWTVPIGQCTRRTKSFKYVDCLFNLSHWNQFGFNLTFEQLEIWRLCFSSKC